MSAPLVRRELRARPGRALMVLATVIVAVAFTTGAFGFTEQLDRLLAPAEGAGAAVSSLPEGTVVVTADTDGLSTATALDDRLIATVRAVPGVASADGSYDQPVAFDVDWGQQRDRPGLLRGLLLSSQDDPARWRVVEGRAPSGPDEVALDTAGLAASGLQLGGSGRMQVPVGTIQVRVVGIVAPTSTADLPPVPSGTDGATGLDATAVALSSAHVVLDPQVGPILLDAVGRVDRITVVPVPGTSPDALASRLRGALPDSLRLDAITSPSAETQQAVGTIQDGVRTATAVYAGVTLLVAALVVVNVLSVIVAQRTRELGLLRLVGARRRTLVRLVLSEAAIIGLAAAVVGGALGVLLAFLGAKAVRIAGVDVSFAVTWQMLAVALAVGLGVTVVGASVPAWRAGRVTPLDALSDTRAGADRTTRAPVPLTLFVGGFGLAAWCAFASGGGLSSWSGVGVGVGLVVGFVGLALLSRWLVVPLAGVCGRVIGWTSVSARLGVGNARRQPSRTAGAASTLMVGLALVAVVATVGASARTTIDQQVRATGHADLYVERRGLVRVSTEALESYLRFDPGTIREVAEVIALDGTVSGPGGTESSGVVSTLPSAARVADLGVTAGAVADGRPGVMVSERAATRLGVSVGDELTVRSTSGQDLRLPVLAEYTNTAIFGGVIVDRASAESIDADGTFEMAALELNDGVNPRAVQRGVRFVAHQFNEVYVDTPEEYAQLRLTVADIALRVIGVLLAGALGVGLLGLAGTLALSTRERRRELVMLRAVGARRRQVRLLIWIEATFIGVVATLVGMGAGLGIGYVGTGVAPESIIESPVVPWGQLAVVAGVGVVLAWAVSLGVARRAARLPPSEAGRL